MTAKPAFRKVLSDLSKGTILKPMLHSYLFEAAFPDLDLGFKKHELGARAPDGWFHPSTHPLWPERMLYWYLAEPTKFLAEPMEYMGTLSVTIGSVMHSFIQACLADLGVLVGPKDGLPYDFTPTGEPKVVDEETGARGAMDGIVKMMIPSLPNVPRHGFEFKTRTPLAGKINDLDLATYKAKHPVYYAQNQEYMRLSGLSNFIVVFLSMGYPWEMTEIHVPADQYFQEEVRQKYLRVRRAVADGIMPEPCCGPRSADAKMCPARNVCPVGLI